MSLTVSLLGHSRTVRAVHVSLLSMKQLGSKFWITNGPIADYIILYAKTDPTSNGGKSLTAFILDTKTEGFSANHIPGKLGMRGSPTGDLSFDNMKVPADCVLGGQGFQCSDHKSHVIVRKSLL